jgi:hypothetical protein
MNTKSGLDILGPHHIDMGGFGMFKKRGVNPGPLRAEDVSRGRPEFRWQNSLECKATNRKYHPPIHLPELL